MHGKTSWINHDNKGVYRGLSNPFEATRYHSLVIQPGTLPEDLDVVAWTDEGEIMGVRHRRFPIEGVQFHPESFLTHEGTQLLKNFRRIRSLILPAPPELEDRAMLTIDEALRAVLERAAVAGATEPLECVLGCILGEDVAADIDLPPFDKALVDGYAVRSEDLQGPDRWLRLGESIMAGQNRRGRWPSRGRRRCMTGAPAPRL